MPTDSKRSLKVFLCHAHSDKSAVRALYLRLVKDGVDAWLDKEKLIPGQDWELEIRKAVREADVVVVCLSKQFNQAGFRQKEVRLALDTAMGQPEGKIFIIPARLEECEAMDSLGKWHWVDLFEGDGYEMLMRALKTRADDIGATLSLKSGRLSAIKIAQQKPVLAATGKTTEKNISEQAPRKLKTEYIVAIIGAAATVIAALIGSLPQFFEPVSVPPSKTSAPIVTPTDSSLLFPTSLPSETVDSKAGTMRLVGEGDFTMGSDSGDSDEQPAHTVSLSSFYIDQYEVTNAFYEVCVEAGACQPPTSIHSSTSSQYFGNTFYDRYPVVYVDWNMAKTYCEWRGSRLPTEAEWEKAARGTDARLYPWGNEINEMLANYNSNVGDTASVGSHSGKSPYDVYDMAGNVWEWVADWYDASYYADLEENVADPLGPSDGQYRILRGGSWSDNEDILRASNRLKSKPDVINSNIGFRCARTAP